MNFLVSKKMDGAELAQFLDDFQVSFASSRLGDGLLRDLVNLNVLAQILGLGCY